MKLPICPLFRRADFLYPIAEIEKRYWRYLIHITTEDISDMMSKPVVLAASA
tara:strand:- start:426 stop:581 length:156 start_codon:yes stop_codon:yes gene_type:complete